MSYYRIIRRNASSALWTPASLSSTYGWWDASDPSTVYDAVSGGNLVTANNAEVWRLEDKSPNGWHALRLQTNAGVNTNPALKTAFANGLNVIRTFNEDLTDDTQRFNSTYANVLRRDDVPIGVGVPALSAIAAYRVDTGLKSTNAAFKVYSGTGSTIRVSYHYDGLPGKIRAFAGDGSAQAITSYVNDTAATFGWRSTCIVGNFDDTVNSVVAFRNSVQQASAATPFTGTSENANAFRVLVGGGAFGSQDIPWGLVGYFGELVIVEDSLSDNTELRHKLEGYLHHKWGMASSLPANHPYKAAPPTA